jgi:hypothetical protein
MFVFLQIRVVNAFRMGLDARYDSNSMSSIHSYHSLQNTKNRKSKPISSPSVEDGATAETQFNN